jgi:hypothetical protein
MVKWRLFERVGKNILTKYISKRFPYGALERREKFCGKINFTESKNLISNFHRVLNIVCVFFWVSPRRQILVSKNCLDIGSGLN